MPRSSDEVIPYWDQDLSFEALMLPNMVDSAAIQSFLPLVLSSVEGRHAANASEFRRDDLLLGSFSLLRDAHTSQHDG